MNLSLRAVRLAGVVLLGLYALVFTVFHIIPDSVGLVVIAFSIMAAASSWANGPR